MTKKDKATTIFLVHSESDPDPQYYRDRAPAEHHLRVLREHSVECELRTIDLLTKVPAYRSIYRAEVDTRAPEALWLPPFVQRIVVFEGQPLYRQDLPVSDEWRGMARGYGASEEDALAALFGYCEDLGWYAYVAEWQQAS